MSAPEDEFHAAPLMVCVPALVTRPDSYLIPPRKGGSTVAFGAAPAPNGGAMLCISIQHGGGELMVAAVPDSFLPQVVEAMLDAVRQMGSGRYAQTGSMQ